jgi:asparagine synthase (glutamine-hydrolysing)
VEAIFGLLHRDSRSRVRAETLMEIASLLGVPSPSVLTEGGFGLGLNRQVIDGRAQKGSIALSADHSVWLGMTGEIERYEVMLHELDRAGIPATGVQDADALLGMFLLHGASFVERVQGFFNIIIWDARHGRLFLYADRCGRVRPLYYHHGRDFFAFGSCAKAVIAHLHVPRELDLTALEEVLLLAHPIAPRTLFSGVSVLTAGTFLEYGDGVVQTHRYWSRQPYRPSNDHLQRLGERYYIALEAAVERSLDTTAETGILLSGGVDSAVVMSLLHRAGHRRLKTFSIHIGDPVQSDREASRFIADRYQTDHHCIDGLDERCLDHFPDMIWHYESPGVDFHPTYLLCQEAKKHCDLVIGGYGNDLIWGVLTPLLPVEWWLARVTPAFSVLRYLLSRRCMGRGALLKLRVGAATTDLRLLEKIARSAQRTGHPLTDMICLDESLFGDQRVFLELGKFVVDAHNLWIRVPYSDSVVTRIAEAVPPAARYRRVAGGLLELKSFFKDLMFVRQVLPREVIYRPKTWMQSPTAEWLRGPLGRTIETVVLSPSARERGYFDMARTLQLIREHRAGAADHTYPFMMLAAIELWHRIFIDPPSIAKPQLNLSAYSRESGFTPSTPSLC